MTQERRKTTTAGAIERRRRRRVCVGGEAAGGGEVRNQGATWLLKERLKEHTEGTTARTSPELKEENGEL
ncbi:hypothetical protein M569_14040 [Genlisea aurea]|uniref:Uncharacterized protein n=1 Tax=Genlisea aurea TaxID=192259 RepID=S8DD79_9LAMI|nr:hypothetical protein M569_14040 [Genlisea aurea]